MKRWVWVLGAVLVLLFLGETGIRLEELKPVQLVYVREENGQVILETDTGDTGEGGDFNCALENMKDRASGRIFLETAELLVLTENGVCCLPQIYEKLRPAAEVCLAEGELEPEAAAEFLTVHKPDVTLQQLRSGEKPGSAEKQGREIGTCQRKRSQKSSCRSGYWRRWQRPLRIWPRG